MQNTLLHKRVAKLSDPTRYGRVVALEDGRLVMVFPDAPQVDELVPVEALTEVPAQ